MPLFLISHKHIPHSDTMRSINEILELLTVSVQLKTILLLIALYNDFR
jgi:hypothetical protein